jgi:hypothetical protein
MNDDAKTVTYFLLKVIFIANIYTVHSLEIYKSIHIILYTINLNALGYTDIKCFFGKILVNKHFSNIILKLCMLLELNGSLV